MNRPGNIRIDKVVLDCVNPAALSNFYIRLLGWSKGYETADFVIIGSGENSIDIGFQRNPDYVKPKWLATENEQQMMLHLDFAVAPEEHHDWVRYAIYCGATKADTQFSEDWTVMLDPEGHV
jgi:hypothetical protein